MDNTTMHPWSAVGPSAPTKQSLQTYADEIVDTAEELYQSLLKSVGKNTGPMTIVACGRKPSYLAATILNLPIYDPKKVNLVVLPMDFENLDASALSELKDLTQISDLTKWMRPYAEKMHQEAISIRV